MLLPLGLIRLMLLPVVLFLRLMLLLFFVADVIATAVLADVIARWLMLNPPMGMCGMWQMLWPLGQCFNFNSDVVFKTSSHI